MAASNFQGWAPTTVARPDTPIIPTCVEGQSVECPFPAFAAADGQPAGNYWFLVDGAPMELYRSADGYILLRSARGNGAQEFMAPGEVLKFGVNGQYDRATTVAIAGQIQEIYLKGPEAGDVAKTKELYFIDRLMDYKSLAIASSGPYVSSIHWEGTGISVLNRSCTDTTLNTDFDEAVYHACGNVNGMHWMYSAWHRWKYRDGNQNMEVWVR